MFVEAGRWDEQWWNRNKSSLSTHPRKPTQQWKWAIHTHESHGGSSEKETEPHTKPGSMLLGAAGPRTPPGAAEGPRTPHIHKSLCFKPEVSKLIWPLTLFIKKHYPAPCLGIFEGSQAPLAISKLAMAWGTGTVTLWEALVLAKRHRCLYFLGYSHNLIHSIIRNWIICTHYV